MKKETFLLNWLLTIVILITTNNVFGQRHMETLTRGLVAVNQGNGKVFISWRLFGTDPEGLAFNLYRRSAGKTVRLNKKQITGGTNYVDSAVVLDHALSYFVKPVLKNKELGASAPFTLQQNSPVRQYLSVPLVPPSGAMIDGKKYSYSANDMSIGDVDGDGQYELILKWTPSNAKNPPQTGLTAPVFIDAYKIDGRRLWRIDLGKNIRAGAAYTQLLVYDFDGDGKAEMLIKTADGTVDGLGKPIGDSTKDWRTLSDPKSPFYGKIVNGPEYLTMFSGQTGEALATTNYIPDRYPLDGWGGIGGNGNNDTTGGRSDRFTACVAYLDGVHPSGVFVRGWYGRSALAAFDYRNRKLTLRWLFDSKDARNSYSGMGNHNLSVGDVDGDGKDEICIGAMTVDDNGKGLYTTGLRHGDAMHMTVMDPARPELEEVFGIHENEGKTIKLRTPGAAMFNAKTGALLWGIGPGVDVGRGVSADIDPTHSGFENWGGPGGLRDVYGKTITEKVPSSTNFLVWWDGDLTRELLDKNRIDKWDWNSEKTVNLLTAEGCVSNNGTKSTPCLSADLLGDWREEVIWRTSDSKELRIYTTTIPTDFRCYTLMHDPQYRLSIAWQNTSYNQAPHTGFYFGYGMAKPPKPNIILVK